MWICPICREPNEAQFTACWKCARADEEEVRRAPPEPARRPDNADWPAIFGDVPRVEAPPPAEPAVPVSREGTVRCPTCGDVFKVNSQNPTPNTQ